METARTIISEEIKHENNKNNTNDIINSKKRAVDRDNMEFVEAYHVSSEKVRVVFDTGASSSMSGIEGRIKELFPQTDYDIVIKGFNGSKCTVDLVGLNEDSKRELYCSKIPPGVVLLSGQQYASDGAAILYKDEGVVIQLDDNEVEELKEFITKFQVKKRLEVKNGIYEVFEEDEHEVRGDYDNDEMEEAYSGRANRFLNTKVHVSNGADLVLSMLLVGLTLDDMRMHLKHKSLQGMPPGLSEKVINSFENRHGRTPDIITLAIPVNRRNRSGLMTRPEQLTKVGERIEIDCAEPDYNEVRKEKEKKVKKLQAHGGATAFAVCVDVYSGYTISILLTSTAKSIEFVQRYIEEYELIGHKVELVAADSGIISMSKFQVLDPEVETYLRRKKIKVERAEPHNHQMGSPTVENTIGRLKKHINVAITFLLMNPAFPQLGFTEDHVYRLWGELLMWATTVINMKPCTNDPKKSRYEVFHNKVPNMQNIRMLPICSIVLFIRDEKSQGQGGVNKQIHKVGVYIGPAVKTPGSARIAYLSRKKRVQVVITSKFTNVTDGWGLNIHKNVVRGLTQILETQSKINDNDVNEELEQEEPLSEEILGNDGEKQNQDKEEDVRGISLPLRNEESEMDMRGISMPLNDDDKNAEACEEQEVEGSTNESVSDTDDDDDESMDHQQTGFHQPFKNSIELEKEKQLQQEQQKQKQKQKKAKKKKAKQKKSQSDVGVGVVTLLPNQQKSSDKEEGKKDKRQKDKHVKFDDTTSNQYEKPYKTSRDHSNERYKNRTERLESAMLADWTEHQIDTWYWSFSEQKLYRIDGLLAMLKETVNEANLEENVGTEEGYKAVTQNVPKTFAQALRDPRWGDAARKELQTLIETKAIVEIDKILAKEMIELQGADLVILFPIYETKEKEGVMVDKVRLVGDGRDHKSAVHTYAATPSREEFLLLMHLIASFGWVYYHVDEIRAFLTARYQGGTAPVVTKFRGEGSPYYQVLGALYGLKSSPRDYQQVVIKRLTELNFKRLTVCSCIFVCREGDDVTFIYDFVDDFIITGNNTDTVLRKIAELRQLAKTTEPIQNARKVLGMELERDEENKVVLVTMTEKILEVCQKFNIAETERKRHTPMPARGYLVHESDLETLSEEDRRPLNKKETSQYLTIVGSLVWLSGIRMDIVFATMFLTWATKSPLVHHLKMSKQVLSYLYHSREMPLVLGGELSSENKVVLTGMSDASLGTGPKGRSIKANMFRLGEAGYITAKSSTSTSVYTSSFEAELDGITTAFKTSSKLMNIFKELGIEIDGNVATIYNDNISMINFVKGEGMAKGIRHVELRMFLVREQYLEGNILLNYMEGSILPVDQLTKVGSEQQFNKFRVEVLGLRLLAKRYKEKHSIQEEVEKN